MVLLIEGGGISFFMWCNSLEIVSNGILYAFCLAFMRVSCAFGAKSMLFFNFLIDYFPVSRIVCEIVMLIPDFAAGKRFKQSNNA